MKYKRYGLDWITEKEQLRLLEKEKKTRDKNKYGRDGYIECAQGTFICGVIKYLIKVLAYYNFDEGFKPISRDRLCRYHAVVEPHKETEQLKKEIDKKDEYSEFLYHDTLHGWNDKQTIKEQIEICRRMGIDDIIKISFSKEYRKFKKLLKENKHKAL